MEGYVMNGDLGCSACPTGCAVCEMDGDSTKCVEDMCKSGYVQDPSDNSCKGNEATHANCSFSNRLRSFASFGHKWLRGMGV